MTTSAPATTHPVWFLFLFVPLGISNGYVTVTLAYQLGQAGVPAASIAALGIWALLPVSWRFLAGPLVDTTLTNKRWFLLASIATGILMIAASLVPLTAANLPLISALALLFSAGSAFSNLAAGSIMAYATAPEEKGRAGGWSQGGNLGGSGIGGGLALWLSQSTLPDWLGGAAYAGMLAGILVGVVCILSSLALLFVHEPEVEHRSAGLGGSLKAVLADVWTVVRSRKGFLALAAFTLPIGVGAMTQLWSGVASDWQASAGWVGLVNGVLGGVLSMLGCIAGGWLCDRMDRITALNVFSLASALCALLMALAPRTELMFIVFVSAYMVLTGFCYAAFGAVVLEAIGQGAAATKFNLLAGIANFPIMYVSLIDGAVHDRWGAAGMLYADALVAVLGTGVFVVAALATRPLYKDKPLSAT